MSTFEIFRRQKLRSNSISIHSHDSSSSLQSTGASKALTYDRLQVREDDDDEVFESPHILNSYSQRMSDESEDSEQSTFCKRMVCKPCD